MRVPGIPCDVEVVVATKTQTDDWEYVRKMYWAEREEGCNKWSMISCRPRRLIMQNGFYFIVGDGNHCVLLRAT